MTVLHKDRYTLTFQRYAKIAAGITILVGVLVLLGWILNIAALKSVLPGSIFMKANTALAFVASGLALWLLQIRFTDARWLTLRRFCTILILLLGLLTLSEYLFGWNLHIDQLLFPDPLGPGAVNPGRMSPTTAVNFILVGTAFLLLGDFYHIRTAQIITLTAALVAVLAVIGYLYGEQNLFQVGSFTAIALPTAITFLILCLGMLFIKPDEGWMAIVSSESAGGILARRVLPAAVIIPPILGWIRLLGQTAGLYDTNFGVAIFAISNIIIFTTLIAWSANSLYRVDHARQQAEEKVRHMNVELEGRVEERTSQLTLANKQLEEVVTEREQAETKFRALLEAAPDAVVIIDQQGRIVLVNSQVETLFGYARQALLGKSVDMLVPERLRGRHAGHRSGYFAEPRVREMGIGLDLHGLRQDGTEFPVEISLSPVQTSDGLLVTADIRDITNRKEAEAALSLEREQMQALMDNIPDTIYFKDTSSHFIRINQAQAHLLGLSDSQQAIGKTDADFQSALLSADFDAEEKSLLQTGQPIIDRREFNPTPNGKPRWLSSTKVPMRDPKGMVTGLIGISRDITERVNAEEAVAQANIRLTERIELMSLLNELEEQLHACATVEEVYQITGKLVSQLFPAEVGALYSINNSRNLLETAAVWGEPPPGTSTFGMDDCWGLRRSQLHVSGGSRLNISCRHLTDVPSAFSVCMPLLAQGESLGILHLRPAPDSNVKDFDESQQQLARLVSDSVALAWANVKLRDTLRQQSIRDPLTELFNRRYMEEALERELRRAARSQTPVGIIMLDVDHFKLINDAHGHEAGDTVFRLLGRFLKEHTRGGDIACRYGGDEFALILPEANLEQTRKRAEQHRLLFKTLPLEHNGRLLDTPTISFGVAAFPEHGATMVEVLRAADAALYRAKQAGRDQVAVAE